MSEKLVINKGTLESIANAIRTKDGSTSSMLVSEMAQKILDIPSGGGIKNIEESELILTANVSTADGFDIEIPFATVPEIMMIMTRDNLYRVPSTTARDLIQMVITMVNGTLASSGVNAISYNDIAHSVIAPRNQNITYNGETNSYYMQATTYVMLKANTPYRIIGIWQEKGE